MSEKPKKVKQLKSGSKLKTRAAVVPKQRKLKKKQDKISAELMVEKKIKPVKRILQILCLECHLNKINGQDIIGRSMYKKSAAIIRIAVGLNSTLYVSNAVSTRNIFIPIAI